MAQATVSTPAIVDRGIDAQGSPLDDMPDQPPTAAQQDQKQPQVRSARPWTLLSRLVGLQNLRSLLSARRNHRCAQPGPAKAVGAWRFPRTDAIRLLFCAGPEVACARSRRDAVGGRGSHRRRPGGGDGEPDTCDSRVGAAGLGPAIRRRCPNRGLGLPVVGCGGSPRGPDNGT